jgi:hypothetical protein
LATFFVAMKLEAARMAERVSVLTFSQPGFAQRRDVSPTSLRNGGWFSKYNPAGNHTRNRPAHDTVPSRMYGLKNRFRDIAFISILDSEG